MMIATFSMFVLHSLAALNTEIFQRLPASVRLLPEDGQVGARGILRLFGLRVRKSDVERAAAVRQVTRAGDLGLLVRETDLEVGIRNIVADGLGDRPAVLGRRAAGRGDHRVRRVNK